MNVNRYIFQSPYSTQVQVGHLDTSVANSENQTQKSKETLSESSDVVEKTAQIKRDKSSIDSNYLLDIYA